jgi:hypothetical protein
MAHNKIWIQAPYTESFKRIFDGVWVNVGQYVSWHISMDENGKSYISGYTIVEVVPRGEEFNV